ncbi:MAG: two-component system sensor histidine kinase NtrB [Thermodesulfobacteriota bacterium]
MSHPEQMNDVHELAQELEKYRQIVETANDAVVSINEHHEVVYMNAAAERMFGFQRSEVLGGDLAPLIPSEHRRAHRHYVERYIRTRRARLVGHSAELEAERRDGTRFPISISFSVADAPGGGLLFTAIMRDLTAERELAERVKRSEQLALVGQMVTTVSHEIRTPLSLIGGFARQLQKEPGLSDKGRHKLDIIVGEVARLEGVLTELNDLSRPQQYTWAEVDLAQVVEQVAELMTSELADQEIKLIARMAPGLPLVAADANRLRQVLINLIQNAAQASQPGDEVVLSLERGLHGGLLLTVADQGCGIPAEHLDQVFKPFFTTKQRGTGLGLPVARRIVEEHGGAINLASHLGQGTTVSVTLPALNPAPPGPRPAAGA